MDVDFGYDAAEWSEAEAALMCKALSGNPLGYAFFPAEGEAKAPRRADPQDTTVRLGDIGHGIARQSGSLVEPSGVGENRP